MTTIPPRSTPRSTPRIRKTTLALALVAVFGAVPVRQAVAASCTWNPATGNWAVGSSWSCGIVPGAADTATVGSGKVVTINTAQSILNLSNAGGVNIDAFLLTLQGGGSTTNSGILNVGAGPNPNNAALQVSAGHNINNTGGVINISADSVLNQFGSAITGGTLNTTGSGKVVVFSSSANVLNNVTLNGVVDVETNANARQRIGNGMTFNGAINIGNGGIVSLDSTLVATNSIGGTGTFNLNDGTARLALEGTGATTLGANIVVRGQGNVGTAALVGGNNQLVNNGRISADVGGGTLTLSAPAGGGSITNNALLDARNGGTLQLSSLINNAGGLINAQNGSVVLHAGTTVSGGTIGSSGSGVFRAASSGANFLDNLTISGVVDMTTVANSRERIVNGATLNGSINIANGGILSLDSGSTTGGAQTLGGTGVINLNDSGARLAIDGTGSTTLGAGITVRGQGNIGQAINVGGNNAFTNNGLISADVNGGTLNIVPPGNGGGFTNNGTLQAINGGTLLLSTNITANPGSQIVAGTGSSVVQNGVRIGGVVNTSGGGLFTAASSASNFLDNVALTGVLDLNSIANARDRIVNGMTLNGSINIANGGILSLDSGSTTGGVQTLGGTGVINLNDSGARLAIDGTGSTTLGANITVRGQGNIGQAINVGGDNALTHNGLISADVNGGTLNIVVPGNGGGSSFTNNGTLQAINGGTLLLSTSITANSGSQIVAGTGSSVVQNGVRISGVVNTSGGGLFTAVSSGSNFLDSVTLSGALDLGSIGNARERIVNGMTLNGAINVANGGILSLDSSATAGGNQTIGGTGTINLNDSGARLAIEGTGSTTLGANIVVRGQGNVGTALIVGGNNTLINNGRISADVGGATLSLTNPASGGASLVVNNSLLDARNGGTLQLLTNVDNNAGLINAQNGSVVLHGGSTITGGTLGSSGTGVFRAASNSGNFLDNVTISGVADLTGAANARERIINGATINGAVNIANGGILSLDSSATPGGNQTIGGTGVIHLNDAGARLAIEGNGTTTLSAGLTVRGQGNIGTALLVGGNNTLVNNGTILADGGTLTITAPASGGNSTLAGSGTLQTSGGTLNLATGHESTQGRLVMGGAGSALGLGTQNLTITNDYTNAQSGTGNAFDRRAGVSGTGQILAGGNAAQTITGTGVTNGNTSNATLTISNVRVGATTFDFQVANTGTTGPSLRGAIQTTANGANLSDGRLSGAGVTAGNYNTGAPGGNTGNLAVTFTAANAGVLAPLNGQVLNLRSNFDNIADQKLNIVLAGGAAAYNAAVGSAVTPVQVANQRIGGSTSATLAVTNAAAASAFSEDLNASVGGSTGAASGSGSIAGRLAGATSGGGAITVAVNTASAGAKTGTVTLNYQTAGAVNGVSNGLGTASVGSQVLTVNGNVYQAAAGAILSAPLNFGTVQVGQNVSQALVIRNTASGPNGFVEDLNASFGAASGTGAGLISGSGSLNGILAGTNSNAGNGVMTVSVNTAAAGTVAGHIAVNYSTAGKVAGVSNGLGTASVGSENHGVAGTIQAVANVINQASPLINNPTIDLGAVRVGAASPTAHVSVTNVATVAPQAALNASISSNGAPITASGSFSLLSPGNTSANQLQVGLNTSVAGNFTGANAGSATIGLVSDAGNVGGCAPNCQLTLSSQMVGVSGKVYTAAVGQVATSTVDFGVVRVGDTVSARNITIQNTAQSTALNDTLRASLSGLNGPVAAGGAVAGILAQSSGTIDVGLNTASAGLVNQTGSVALLSQNADMADVSAGADAAVQVKAQINNLADGFFNLLGGLGMLTRQGDDFVLNLGDITLGSSPLERLMLDNHVTGPADDLSGLFDLSAADDFSYAGWNPLSGLAAGQGSGDLEVTVTAGTLGAVEDIVTFNGLGTNASDTAGLAQMRRLIIRANVVDQANTVPEPGTLWLMLLAGVAAFVARRRQMACA